MSTIPVHFVLTDIEGTTTSISFVTDELFPYFRANIRELLQLKELSVVKEAFDETVSLAHSADGLSLSTDEEIIDTLYHWSEEDRKITPLKTLQGILWEKGYLDGTLKGHLYDDVAPKLREWHAAGIGLGVFSSGSMAAQKLLFGYSVAGDLTPLFSHFFDTTAGGKREITTYRAISSKLLIPPATILFLSDVVEELQAAEEAGYQTIQLVRPGIEANWKRVAMDFREIAL